MNEADVDLIEFCGRPAMWLRAGDGAEAVLLLHGAHLVSWRSAGVQGAHGSDWLFLSERAVFSDGQAVRGGVPVIFPQFEKRGPLPRHGLARTRNWQPVEQRSQASHATATLRLTDDDSTHEHWSHQFIAELTASIGGQSLDIELCVRNTGVQPISFTAALHTYLRLEDLSHARLAGLAGLSYLDNTTGNQHIDTAQTLVVTGEVDRIYFGVQQPLVLREPGRALSIRAQAFEDVVVWNPGPDKCADLADMPEDGWRQMLCVEAACIGQPVTLSPGEEWVGRQSLTNLT